MKKVLILLVAALAISSAATAQAFKLDAAGHQKKMAASDEDIQDAKRVARAATWVTRGNVYYNADVAPTAPLYQGMGVMEVNLLISAPSEKKEEVVGNETYQVWVYPDFDLYLMADKLIFWKQKTRLTPNGLQVAFEAYTKAAEIDPRQASKMKAEVEKLVSQFNLYGDNDFQGRDYTRAVGDFAKAYEYSTSPLVDRPDTLAIFNAGYVALLAEQHDDALKYLGLAQGLGYEGDQGELYYYQYAAHYGKNDLAAAEQTLRTGIQKYPANNQLIEALILLYTSSGQDASQIIPMVEEAVQKNPDNHMFHFGLGLIYNKLDNFVKAAEEFKKASELNPEDFASAFNLGLTYLRQADAMLPQINAIPFNDRAQYDQKMNEFNTLYKQAIPYVEQAHALNPGDSSAVDILKSVYFRFRDESPEMMQNYEKYNELLKTMPQ